MADLGVATIGQSVASSKAGHNPGFEEKVTAAIPLLMDDPVMQQYLVRRKQTDISQTYDELSFNLNQQLALAREMASFHNIDLRVIARVGTLIVTNRMGDAR